MRGDQPYQTLYHTTEPSYLNLVLSVHEETDQWNGIESPEIDHTTYENLAHCWGKEATLINDAQTTEQSFVKDKIKSISHNFTKL